MEKGLVLNNKMPVYYYLNNNIHGFCMSYYIKAGSVYEDYKINGITHFLEHIVIRNINKILNHSLYKELDKHGLNFNACTYKEFVRFFIIGPSESFDYAISLFSLLWNDIILDNDGIKTELDRIKSEIKESRYDNEFDSFTDKKVWQDTPLAFPIVGNITSLNKISRKKLNSYKKSIFSSSNSFIYVTGNIDENNINNLKEKLKSIEMDSIVENNNIVSVPLMFSNRLCNIYSKNCNNTKIKFSFDFDLKNKSDPSISLLYDILFDGESCEFFQRMSEEKGIIYSYNAFLERYINIGVLSFSYDVSISDFYSSIEETINILKFAKNSLTTELDYAMPKYSLNSTMLLDDVDDLNWTMAYENHILNNNYTSIENRLIEYKKTNIDDVTKLANEIFNLKNLTLCYESPKNKIDENKIKNIISCL